MQIRSLSLNMKAGVNLSVSHNQYGCGSKAGVLGSPTWKVKLHAVGAPGAVLEFAAAWGTCVKHT